MKSSTFVCLIGLLNSLIYCNGFTGIDSQCKNTKMKYPLLDISKKTWSNLPFGIKHHTHSIERSTKAMRSKSILLMSYDDGEGEGPAILTVLGVVLAIVILVGTSIAPTLDMVSGTGGSNDYNVADSVVTRQDSMEKRKEYSNANASDKLSRSKIQEKLNRVPVFYIADSNGNMNSNIYLSYQDASNAIGDSMDTKVKCTTMDQVTYPLIFKRGRMRMAPPPLEIQKAEDILSESISNSDASTGAAAVTQKFQFVPSTRAKKDANDLQLTYKEGDIPLFLADRLAFASNDGPQIPLFLEKEDCITSYSRLRKAGGNKLPEEPNIRTTTFLDIIQSMEKGTRPGVRQLQFYATAEDLLRASEML